MHSAGGLLMRPQGEVRQVLAAAAAELAEQRGHFSWRDVAEHAQVGYLAARRTVENMARAGDLVPVGQEKRAHSRRWVTLYEPRAAAAPNFATATTGGDGLAGVMRSWRGRRG